MNMGLAWEIDDPSSKPFDFEVEAQICRCSVCVSSMKDGMGKGEQLRHKKLLGSAVCRISVGQYHLPETGLVSIHVMSSANWGGTLTSKGLIYPAVVNLTDSNTLFLWNFSISFLF